MHPTSTTPPTPRATRPARTARPVRAALALLASVGLLAACAADDGGAEAADDGPRQVTVSMSDYGYDGLPAELAAGSTLAVENTSGSELHELVAIRLPDDEQRPAAELVQLPPEELQGFFPLVTTVLLQAPGADETIPAVGDGTLAEPGRYLVLCAIPTGADPQEYLEAAAASEEGPPEVEGGPPHFANGMYGEVVVTQ